MYKLIIFLFATSLFANCAYLPSSQKCRTRDFYGSLDFLWWQASEKGLEYASKNTQSFFDQNIQIYEPSFEFNPAFRLGLGYHIPHDDWDLELVYTFYRSHHDNHAHHDFGGNPNGGIRSVWTSAVAFQGSNFRNLWEDASSKWKLHANLFDLLLKNHLSLTSAVTLEPAFGMKMALLQQNYKVVYQNGNTAFNTLGTTTIQFLSSTIAMKNRSLNIGPSASIMTRWNCYSHLDILGSFAGSVLASYFSVGRNEWDVSLVPAPQFDSIRENNTYWLLRPQTAMTLGLGWSDCTCKKIRYGFSGSYEAQVYWKQNMLYRFIGEANAAMIAPTQGDLFFYGLTFDAFLDF